jgi:predicted DNA binding CopG/RHH family protein
MRDHYDFSKIKRRKNLYSKYLKQPVTMRLDRDTVTYFKSIAEETGIPYQSLINLYLRDCASRHRKLQMKWFLGSSHICICNEV